MTELVINVSREGGDLGGDVGKIVVAEALDGEEDNDVEDGGGSGLSGENMDVIVAGCCCCCEDEEGCSIDRVEFVDN
jgi:hypothetical protein